MKRLIILLLFLFILPSSYATEQLGCDPSIVLKKCDPSISLNECIKTQCNEGLFGNGSICLDRYNSKYTKIKPSYAIVPIIDKQTISAGHRFYIFMYITGGGKVSSNFIFINFPVGFLSNEINSTVFTYIEEASFNMNGQTISQAIWLNKSTQNQTIIQGQGVSVVSSTFLEAYPDKEIIFGERAYNGNPSIVVEAITSKKAPAGDNIVRINFKYSDGEAWYTTHSDVTIHVKHWYEKLGYRLFFIAITVLLSAFLTKTGATKLKTFFISSKKRNHIKQYQKFTCPECGKKYTYKTSFDKHFKDCKMP